MSFLNLWNTEGEILNNYQWKSVSLPWKLDQSDIWANTVLWTGWTDSKLIYKIQQMLMNLLTHANESDKKSQDIQQKHLSLEPKLSYIFKRTWNKA